MIIATLKGMAAHKLRVLLTSVSIVLGVAFVAGTLVLTDSLNGSFGEALRSQYAGVDVVVRAQAAFTDSEAAGQRQSLPDSLVERVVATPGVQHAEGFVSGPATIVGPDGSTLGAGARSNDGMSVPVAATFGKITYSAGRAPAQADEIAIDAASAAEGAVAVGDQVRVLFAGPARQFTVAGIARFGDADKLGATTTALFDLATAQQVLGKPGELDEIRVVAADGASASSLSQAFRPILPSAAEAVPAHAVVDEQTKLVKDSLGFISTFLLVFAGIAVFVGSFIIWNTFTILVAQRSRELALLRAIGATRRQVRRSVLTEAAVVGVVASAAGLLLGLAVARLLVLLMTAMVGLDLPAVGGLSRSTVAVSFLVGTAVTLVAAVAPARNATRVPPVQALRDATPASDGFPTARAVVGALVLAAGGALLAAGLFGDGGMALVGAGAVVALIGVTALLPLVARALAAVLGAPVAAAGGVTGELARGNAMRNPRRTASTAAALMIGLAMVVSVTILAASLKASIGGQIEQTVRAELVVQQSNAAGAGLSPQVAEAIRSVPGVAAVAEFGYGRARVGDEVTYITPVDPASVEAVLDLALVDGSVAALTDGVLVHEDVAQRRGWGVGSTVPVSWPATGERPLVVAGVFSHKDAVGTDYLVSLDTYDRNATGRLDPMILVRLAEGADTATVQRALAGSVADFADTDVLTAGEFNDSVAGQVDDFLLFITVLLLLAVFIALMGIVNTLALSVLERTREIGLLRAIGMTRRQVRSVVRWESVLIAAIGALAGAVVGTGFGVAFVRALRGDGVDQLAIPWPRLTVYVLLAAAAAVVAAVLPARRAARTDVLRAVVSD